MSKENIKDTSATKETNKMSPEIQPNKPTVAYLFLFTNDGKFLSSPNRDLLLALAGPNNTIPHAEEAIAELHINHKLTITRLIPTPNQEWRIIPSTGLACRARSSKAIELLFNPDNPNIVKSLTYWSGRQIVHELSHIARMIVNPNIHKTLLDALASEGLGVYYEEHWKHEYKESPWGHALSKQELEMEWQRAQKELSSKTFDYGDWFYGRKNGHKTYAGYSLGNALVSKFFSKHSGLPMSEAVRISSYDLLKESGF